MGNNPFSAAHYVNNEPNMRTIYQALVNSQNPMQLFTNIAKNNPNMKPILDALNSGGNPQQLFYSLCKQRGIDPQQFIKNITG